MRTTYLIFVILTLTQLNAWSQQNSPYLVRSALDVSGGSSIIISRSERYIIQHSLGQQGSIGVSSTSAALVFQGFIQPLINRKVIAKIPLIELKVNVYPNPFIEDLNISFLTDTEGAIEVQLYDLMGHLIWTRKYSASDHISLSLQGLPEAQYILKIQKGSLQTIRRIIKI